MFALEAAAAGAPIITLNSTFTGGHSGTIVYDPTVPSGNPNYSNRDRVIGTGIDIDSITGTGTLANSGITLRCFGCLLNFVTGPVINDVTNNGQNWTFAGGGTFQIFGAIDLNQNGINDDMAPGSLLLSGMFDAPVTVGPDPNAFADFRLLMGTLVNTLNDQLDTFYGNAPQSTYLGVYNQLTGANRIKYDTTNNRWRFATGLAVNNNGMKDGFVRDTVAVPEPATVSLLSLSGVLFGFAFYRRKRTAATL